MNTESNGVERAMSAVNLRVNEFEHSLDNIIGKIEDISATFQRLIGIGSRQTQRISEVKNRTLETVSPFFRGSRRIGNRVMTQVRDNPRTVLIGAALVLGGLYLITRARGQAAGEVFSASGTATDRDERFMH